MFCTGQYHHYSKPITMKPLILSLLALPSFCSIISQAGEVNIPKFRAIEIDSKIEIGYGVAVADVDGDKKPDILVADKKQFVWYRNPDWQKFVLAENLAKLDN